MDFSKTLAVTLRRTDYKDSSQIITFYTRDYGKIQALAKGVKRSVKGICGGIDLLTYNQIVFIHKGSYALNILTEWALRDNFYLLRENPKKYYSALYILELIREFTEENDKNKLLFDLFVNTLRVIADRAEPMVNIIAFEVQMLALLGYMPQITYCVNCKGELHLNNKLFFSALEGGVICADCGRNIRKKIKIYGATIKTLNYLVGINIQKAGRLSIQPYLHDDLKRVLRYYLSFIINKKLKMWRYI